MEHIIKSLLLALTLMGSALTAQANPLNHNDYQDLMNLSEGNFKNELKNLLRKNFRSLGYKRARIVIFEKVDNHNGVVCGVYEKKCIKTRRLPSHKVMNVEHTWPQSKGARGDAKSDLHHLFPTDSQANSRRSSFEFCNVNKVKWQGDYSRLGYNMKNRLCFEPPHEHKGNVARALFYFAIKYNIQIDKAEEDTMRQWHVQDPVDQAEIARNRNVSRHQGNINYFIEHPEFVDKISNF